jgi:hypothetical protein
MRIVRLRIITILFIGITINAQCQDGSKKNLTENYIRDFSASYSLKEKIKINSNEFKQSSYVKNFENSNLKDVSVLLFTSKEMNKTKLRFKIMIYKYVHDKAASEKFKELEAVKTTQDESIFSKDWDYVILDKNLLIRLDAGCLYSQASWIKLKEQFLKPIEVKTKDTIECMCGGNCK